MSWAVYNLYVDWDNDGNFDGIYDDITIDLIEIPRIMRGKDKQLGHAPAGILEVRLKDFEHKYSPENVASPLYGNLIPYRPIRLTATFGGTTYNLFNGFISKIVPHPHWAKQDCYIYALDGIDWLARGMVSTKVFTGICQHHSEGDDGFVVVTDTEFWYQTFIPETDHSLVGVSLKLFKVKALGRLTVGVRATVAHKPTGEDLTLAIIDQDKLTENENGLWEDVSLPSLWVLTDVEYAFVLWGQA